MALGIGIDIEAVAALPEADDYREAGFYRDTFTPSEIAYCLRQPNVRASFCGTWATKEAILKAGLAPMALSDLRQVEIQRDEDGRPVFPGASLSISHTGDTAVAVCLALSAPKPPPPPLPALAPAHPETLIERPRRQVLTTAAVAAVGVVIGAAVMAMAHFV